MGLWIKTPDGTLEKAAGADGYYLPLAGGNVTGELTASYFHPSVDGDYSWLAYSFNNDRQAGFYLVEPQKVGVRQNLLVHGDLGFGAHAAGPIIKLFHNADNSNIYGFGLNTDLVAFWAGGKQVGGFDSLGNLYLDGTVSATRGIAFAIADGIDTADVLERAETAAMPVVDDDEGVATMDADVESITVNEVVTALLAKVKELSAEIEELKGA